MKITSIVSVQSELKNKQKKNEKKRTKEKDSNNKSFEDSIDKLRNSKN